MNTLNQSRSTAAEDLKMRGPPTVRESCLTPNLLSEIMTDADTSFCRRYTGVDGGGDATKLSTYAFMNEVSCNGGSFEHDTV